MASHRSKIDLRQSSQAFLWSSAAALVMVAAACGGGGDGQNSGEGLLDVVRDDSQQIDGSTIAEATEEGQDDDSTTDDSVAGPTTTTAEAVGGVRHPFCAEDDELLASMAEVIRLGPGDDRFAFNDAHTRFLTARAAWNPPTPDLFDAGFEARPLLSDVGVIYPQTGDPLTVAGAFLTVLDDSGWESTRADIDAWRSTNCAGGTGSPVTTMPVSTTTTAPSTTITTLSTSTTVDYGPTSQEALAEGLALSMLRGEGDLSRLVDTVAEARCIAEHAVSDIGVDRYWAAYGISADSEGEETAALGVPYDRIDAEAVGAAIAACVDLESRFRRLMDDNEIPDQAHDCLVADGLDTFEELIVAELNQEPTLIDDLVTVINETSERCISVTN